VDYNQPVISQERVSLSTLKRIGVLAHPLRPQTAPVAEHIADTLRRRSIETWLYTRWDEGDVLPEVRTADMVVAIGGDGAMLRAARVCAPYAVPVLGVNMGQLGFLTEINGPESWDDNQLDLLLRAEYWIEARMMIRASVLRAGVMIAEGDALNEVVVSRGAETRIIRLQANIDGGWATTYNADGLVIATATGSTAYALALGGPILPPELRNILIVPIAPHLSLDRAILLSEGATVEVILSPDTRTEVVLTIDGTKKCELQPDDWVRIQASEYVSRFVRMRERNYFYRSLLDRLEPRLPVRSEPDRKQI
jgi:NAD+ kinase